ncbi:serine/threonine-protein kinase [Verrucomicrobiota bacterium sgz303538]
MPEESRCPQCGAPLSPNAPAGLCPACLLRQGVDADSVTAAPPHGFEPPSVADIAPLFPQLEILEFIGKGGMGAVYKARQKDLDRIVALKILPPSLGEAPAFAERFAREAKALAKLNHPGIVTIHEFGRADGLYYFLMEFVDGVNLRQLLAGGRVSPREALAIVPEICDALQFAHDHGIVHRDIKPANILIDRRGRVKVADFGLAKLIEAGAEAAAAEQSEAAKAGSPLTEAGNVMGTPSYMAPEQTERPDEVDHRADIYSLGVVLYELLTGELPTGTLQPPSRKVRIDVRLDEMVLRALEKKPELRYQQASEMKTQVEAIHSAPAAADSVPPVPPPLQTPQTALPKSRFSRTAIVGAMWACLFFLATVPAYFVTAVTVTPAGQRPPGIGPVEILLITFLLIPGLTAPFGTTILGSIALSQIRRSEGRLHGFGLAVFDVLLFPLLVLDAVIAICGTLVYKAVSPALNSDGAWTARYHDQISLLVILLIVLVCAAVDYLIIRKVWRTVKLVSTDASTPVEKARPQHKRSKGKLAWTAAGIILIVSAAVMFWPPVRKPASPLLRQYEAPVSERFPQGSVEVVGISYHPSKDQPWWLPDGTAIGKGAYVTQGSHSNADENQQTREFVLRLKDLPKDASQPIWKLESAGWAAGEVRSANGQYDPELHMFSATLPKLAKAANLKVGVSVGPWNTLGEIAAGGRSQQSTSRSGISYTVSFLGAAETDGRTTTTVVHTVQNQDVRVVAVDNHGIEHSASGIEGSGSSEFATMTVSFDRLPLAEVKKFRFQARPYHWIEIRNVALNPNPNSPIARMISM